MGIRHVADDSLHHRPLDHGHEALDSWWQPGGSGPLSSIDTGDNSAGNGGSGYFSGNMIDSSYAAFEPFNMAEAGSNATAAAHQTNVVYLDQSATQIAGIGGNGGDGNAAIGGSVSGSGPGSAEVIATGGNSAGNGGDGYFSGSLVHTSVAVYDPINIAVAGPNSTADAEQSNNVTFDQSAVQMAGIGGNGGSNNVAIGGSVSGSGPSSADVIATGGNSAGNGGDGYFSGSLVHTSVAVYDPINIAVAGYDSTSHADQSNNVTFDQSAVQMAGIGGNGGNGNAAVGGTAGELSSILGLIGSDVIATGGNSAGNGGEGHFSGSMIDLSIAIYAPINIAVAGPHSTADAEQTNNVTFDQHATQIAGVGGEGGHGNTAIGGDVAMLLLSDLHLLGHA